MSWGSTEEALWMQDIDASCIQDQLGDRTSFGLLSILANLECPEEPVGLCKGDMQERPFTHEKELRAISARTL